MRGAGGVAARPHRREASDQHGAVRALALLLLLMASAAGCQETRLLVSVSRATLVPEDATITVTLNGMRQVTPFRQIPEEPSRKTFAYTLDRSVGVVDVELTLEVLGMPSFRESCLMRWSGAPIVWQAGNRSCPLGFDGGADLRAEGARGGTTGIGGVGGAAGGPVRGGSGGLGGAGGQVSSGGAGGVAGAGGGGQSGGGGGTAGAGGAIAGRGGGGVGGGVPPGVGTGGAAPATGGRPGAGGATIGGAGGAGAAIGSGGRGGIPGVTPGTGGGSGGVTASGGAMNTGGATGGGTGGNGIQPGSGGSSSSGGATGQGGSGGNSGTGGGPIAEGCIRTSSCSCADYCQVFASKCSVALFYPDVDCEATCMSFGWSTSTAGSSDNSLGCRVRALMTLASAEACAYAGPTGGNMCARNRCNVYCDAMERNCAPPPPWTRVTCLEACDRFPPNPPEAKDSLFAAGAREGCFLYWAGRAGRPDAAKEIACANASPDSLVCK